MAVFALGRAPAQQHEPASTQDRLSALAPRAEDWELQLAHAVAQMRTGAYGRAATLLATTATPDDAARARVERTLERARALLGVRQRALEPFADGKKILEIEFGAKRGRGRVEKLTEAAVAIRAGKVEEFDLEQIAPAKLDIFARRNGALELTAWQCGYLQFLADGAADKWKRKLTSTDATAQALLQDVDSYANVLALAEPSQLLAKLAAGADGIAAVNAIETLVTKHHALPSVSSRRDALRARAQELLAAAFDPFTAENLGVHAKVERGANGRLRVHWDGKDKAQIADFTIEADYLKELVFEGFAAGDLVTIEHRSDGFGVRGHGALVLPIVVAPPFEVTVRMRWPDRGMLSLCASDDGEGRLVRAALGGSMEVIDESNAPLVKSNRVTYADTDYLVCLRHDGTTLSTTVDGKPTAKTAEIGTRARGRVLLHAYGTETCRVAQLTIEGTIDAEALAAMREQFVARRLRAIFGDK